MPLPCLSPRHCSLCADVSGARRAVPNTAKMLKCASANDIRVDVRRPVDTVGTSNTQAPRAVWGFTVGSATHQLGMKARYDNPAPFVAAAWRRLGYEPMVIVVADDEAHAARLRGPGADGTESLLELRAMNVDVHVTVAPPGQSARLMGQLVRMAAPAAAPLWDADSVIMSDADMMPLSASYFRQGRRDAMVVYNHGIIADQFAMCYLQAPSSLWREVLRVPGHAPLSSFPDAVVATFGAKASSSWGTDQEEITKRVKAWPKWSAEGQKVPVATWPGWRLDRGTPAGEFHKHVDMWQGCELEAIDYHMHYLMPGDCDGEAGKALSRLVELLFAASDADALLQYMRRIICAKAPSA